MPNNGLDHVEDARSRYASGVNTLLGDGSVRIIANTINPFTWEILSTRSGDEVIADY